MVYWRFLLAGWFRRGFCWLVCFLRFRRFLELLRVGRLLDWFLRVWWWIWFRWMFRSVFVIEVSMSFSTMGRMLVIWFRLLLYWFSFGITKGSVWDNFWVIWFLKGFICILFISTWCRSICYQKHLEPQLFFIVSQGLFR